MTLGPVRVMGAGVVVMICVEEVCSLVSILLELKMFCCVVPCPSLTDPNNGVMTCSLGDDGVPSYKDTCSFTCNTGYELTVSDTRICQSNGSWSGNDDVCRRSKFQHIWYQKSLF